MRVRRFAVPSVLPFGVTAALTMLAAQDAHAAEAAVTAKTTSSANAADKTAGKTADKTADKTTGAPNRLFLHGDAYGGYSRSDQAGDGVGLGLDALLRWRFLQVGALAESSSGRKETIAGYGIMGGLAYYKHPAIGFDLVGVFGVHVYDHIGAELASNGVHGNVGFLQAQIGVTFLPLKPFTFGAWVFYGDDLVRASRTYSVPNNAPGAAPLSTTATIGEPTYGAMLRLGFDLPL